MTDRELLEQAAEVLWECSKTLLVVSPMLDVPYPDAPETTTWVQRGEPAARRAHDLRQAIKRHLKEPRKIEVIPLEPKVRP